MLRDVRGAGVNQGGVLGALADFVHAPAGRLEERLLGARACIRRAIERGVRRGAGVALAMAEVLTDVNLQGLEGFPPGEGCANMRTSSRATSRRWTWSPPLFPPRGCLTRPPR